MITLRDSKGHPIHYFRVGECVPPHIEAARLRHECSLVFEANKPNLQLVGEAVRSFLDATASYEQVNTETA